MLTAVSVQIGVISSSDGPSLPGITRPQTAVLVAEGPETTREVALRLTAAHHTCGESRWRAAMWLRARVGDQGQGRAAAMKMSRNDNFPVAKPACMAGVLVSRPKRRAM